MTTSDMYSTGRVCIPESAAEPHSLAMMLPVRHSSTRRLNWQLEDRKKGNIIRRGDEGFKGVKEQAHMSKR